MEPRTEINDKSQFFYRLDDHTVLHPYSHPVLFVPDIRTFSVL